MTFKIFQTFLKFHKAFRSLHTTFYALSNDKDENNFSSYNKGEIETRAEIVIN
jgi:hypothetical protein